MPLTQRGHNCFTYLPSYDFHVYAHLFVFFWELNGTKNMQKYRGAIFRKLVMSFFAHFQNHIYLRCICSVIKADDH